MSHVIVGTSGHIDHGKTTLIRALTGIETDRLKEEKKRGITIELGFAYFDLPSGRRAGIVDVPGHERFIKNMLAGVGGIDLVLFLVAADEGVMPQTIEHLEIIDLLGVKRGIIVITKADLVDEEMLELVEEEILETVQGTVLENASVIPVSAVSGMNLDQLTACIDHETAEVEERNLQAPARLNIDRVFTMKGHGTVVTGTLIEGQLKVDDQVEIYPVRKTVKVRSLQVHGESVQTAAAGQRTAINLSGVKVDEIHRGDVIAKPGSLTQTSMIDVRLTVLKDCNWSLKHGLRVRFFHGTREMIGRLILFEQDQLEPGDEVYAQFRFPQQLACKYGDRFVIRFYSPLETIGGGVIIDSNASKHRRYDLKVIEEMELKERGSIDELIETLVRSEGDWIVSLDLIAGQLGESEEEIIENIQKLKEEKILLELTTNRYAHRDRFDEKSQELITTLQNYHLKHPLERGIGKEEIRNRIYSKMKKSIYEAIIQELKAMRLISDTNGVIALDGFEISMSEKQKKRVEEIRKIFEEGGYKPPTLKALQQGKLSKEDMKLVNLMVQEGLLVRVNPDIIYENNFYLSAKKVIINYIKSEGKLSVKDLKDLIDISRKYSVPLLEHLDETKVTKRVGDFRRLF
jgi:selenocysteine-specific elongation factor